MKRVLLAVTGTILLLASSSIIIGLQRFSSLEAGWQSKLADAGLQLSWQQAPQWQLFPPALKAQGLILRSHQSELLRSETLLLRPSFSDILSGRSAALELDNAQLNYQLNADGSGNWDAALKQAQGQGLRDITLRNTDITISLGKSDAERPVVLTLKSLTLQDMDKARAKLATELLFSHQSDPAQNLLIEAKLQSDALWQAGKSLSLENLQLDNTVSSTAIPGVLSTKTQGSLQWQQGKISSQSLQSTLDYAAPGNSPLSAVMKTKLLLDTANDVLALPAFSLRSAEHSLQAQGLQVHYGASAPELRADALIFVPAKKSAHTLPLTNIKLQAATEPTHDVVFAADLGQGKINLPVSSHMSPDHIAVTVNGSLKNIELADLRSLLDDKSAQGKLDADFILKLKGSSREEILEKAKGSFNIQLSNARLYSSNPMPKLRERLNDYAALLPEMQPSDASTDKAALLKTLKIHGSFQDGIVSTADFSADLGLASIKAAGRYDSHKPLMDYHGQLHLAAPLFVTEKAGLDLPLTCSGNLQDGQLSFAEALETDCRVDDEAKRELLARSLIRRFRQ